MEQHQDMPGHMVPFFSMPRQQVTKDMYRRSPSEDEGRSKKRPRASRPKVKSGKALYISKKNRIDLDRVRLYHLQGIIKHMKRP
jgi:hypothetical protein